MPRPFLPWFRAPGPVDRGAWLLRCLFGVGGELGGGGRRGAKRPEIAWPGAFDPGPRYFVWLAGGGGPAGPPPPPPNAAAPPYLRPGPPAPPTGPPDRPWATVPRGQGAALGPGGGGGVRGPGPWPSNKPAAGLRPAAGGWAAPPAAAPPPLPRLCGRPVHRPKANPNMPGLRRRQT